MKGVALLLTTQNLSKTFGSEPLFVNISLNIFEGDRLGLIGPNGSGKSTLMQILAGRVEQTKGTSRTARTPGWLCGAAIGVRARHDGAGGD